MVKGNLDFSLNNPLCHFLIFSFTILDLLKTESLYTYIPLLCWECHHGEFVPSRCHIHLPHVFLATFWVGSWGKGYKHQWNNSDPLVWTGVRPASFSIFSTYNWEPVLMISFKGNVSTSYMIDIRWRLTTWAYSSCSCPVFT